jgi:DNA topoisomerase VI subunit B
MIQRTEATSKTRESSIRRRAPHTIARTTFRTSRSADFFTRTALISQIGHEVDEWPLAILKESIDNSLDACEDHDIPPRVTVAADATGITVSDNGPGIPETTIDGALDFSVRASSREAYVAPDRGRQGNALMTLAAMPYVIDRDGGRLVITANGIEHRIRCRWDAVMQEVVVDRVRREATRQEKGTTMRMEWNTLIGNKEEPLWPFDEADPLNEGYLGLKESARRLLTGFALFNPHLSIEAHWFGETLVDFEATSPAWKKWRPSMPSSALWYEPEDLERLLGAYVVDDAQHGRRRTVAEFLELFDGFSGSAKRKRVIDQTGLARVYLDQLATDGQFDRDVISRLLAAMRLHSRAVSPARLGVIGPEHFRAHLDRLGCKADSFEYAKVACVTEGIPFALEAAFGWLGYVPKGYRYNRKLVVGVNWSSAIQNPFRSFKRGGGGLEGLLSDLMAGDQEPVVVALHLGHPRIRYPDKGKSAIIIPGVTEEEEE